MRDITRSQDKDAPVKRMQKKSYKFIKKEVQNT